MLRCFKIFVFIIFFTPIYLGALKQAYDLQSYNNLGIQYELQGDIDNAFKIYAEAMHVNPNFIESRFNTDKDPDRYDVKNLDLPKKCTQWNGEDLTGKSILVYMEKGLGDSIQFCRFIPLLKSRSKAKRIIFKPQTPLVDLLKTADFDSELCTADSNLSDLKIDYYVSLLSLPHLLNLNIKDISTNSGYLHANKQKIEDLKQKYFNNNNLKIGIAWQGDPNHVNDKNRSMPLSELYALAKIPGVTVYSLQKNYGTEQLKYVPNDIQIIDLSEEEKDFCDTAAIIENLDLLIGVDTALIHLSSALNKKTILLLPYETDWRWFCYCSKNDVSWYSSLIKIRQTQRGLWKDVIQKSVIIIKDLLKYKPQQISVFFDN